MWSAVPEPTSSDPLTGRFTHHEYTENNWGEGGCYSKVWPKDTAAKRGKIQSKQ